MTERTLDVHLDGRLCGWLNQSSSGNLIFTYAEHYRTAEGATPLSLSMPLVTATHRKRVVLPFLQGLLPDSDEALGAMARRYAVSSNNPFALLEHVGLDTAGAVQIVPHGTPAPDAVSPRARVRAVSEAEVSVMLSRVVSEYTEGAPYYDGAGRFSLAGAQPKIALHRLPDGSWAVPEDATPTTHILKPVAGRFRRIDVVEQLTMRAAAALGSDVARSDLVRIGDWDVLVSERYDRTLTDRTWRRLHQEDFCQALSVSPARKYQERDGGPGIAHIAGLVRALPIRSDRLDVGESFYRAFVFNVVAGCTDAHAKNYSLLLDGSAVRLAPLYDLLTYAGYWDGQGRLASAMSVDGEYALDRITAAGLARVGAQFGVAPAAAASIVETTRQGVADAFELASAEVISRAPEAEAVVARVLSGLRELPLVRNRGWFEG